MRVFVAVRVPGELARPLGQAQDELRRRVIDVKWVEAANLHLTMRFFGEIGDAELERATGVVRAITQAVTPFTVELETIGSFPARGRPRVIWVGIRRGARELQRLASRLDEGFGQAGLGREDRPFRPHLTIGRLRAPDRRRDRGRRGRRPGPAAPLQAVTEIHDAIGSVRCGPLTMEVSSVAVVESLLRPQGPVYKDLAVVALGRSGASAAADAVDGRA